MSDKVVKQRAHGGRQGCQVMQACASCLFQPCLHSWPIQLEDEVIGAQAGDIDLGVKTFQGIVEIVGQEDRFQLAALQHLLRPVRAGHLLGRQVVELFPVRLVNSLFFKPKQLLCHLQQPAVLDGIGQIAHLAHQARDQLARLNALFFDPLAWQTG